MESSAVRRLFVKKSQKTVDIRKDFLFQEHAPPHPAAVNPAHYAHHHSPVTSAPIGPNKPKKSIAERIGKTLDKIALPSGPKESKQKSANANNNNNNVHYNGSLPMWTVPAGKPAKSGRNGREQSRLAATTSLLYPWESYNHPGGSSQRYDYGDMTYDYQHRTPNVNNNLCGCNDYLFGSVRGGYPGSSSKSGRCKRCHKVRVPPNVHLSAKRPVYHRPLVPPGHHPAYYQQHTRSYHDPYEYMRHTRISGAPSHEWHSYWVDEDQEQLEEEVHRLVKSSSEKNLKSGGSSTSSKREAFSTFRSSSSPALVIEDLDEITDDSDLEESANSSEKVIAKSANGQTSESSRYRSILDPSLNPYLLNGAQESSEDLGQVEQEVEEEESAAEGYPNKELDTSKVTDELRAHNESENTNGQSQSNNEVGEKERETRKEEEVNNVQKENNKIKPNKSSLIDHRNRKSNSNKKYFSGKRRAPSFHIDEVILEEDEEALEAENLEVISSSPEFPVKSILKQSSLASLSEEIETENGDVSSLTIKKEVTFCRTQFDQEVESDILFDTTTNTVCSMGNNASLAPSSSGLKPSNPSNKEDSVSPSDSDEWTEYDKVIVSHNLAEEILDEIYGKLEHLKVDNDDELEREISRPENDITPEILPEIEFNSDACGISPSNSPQQEEKTNFSLADEILDELYGKNKQLKEQQQKIANVSNHLSSPTTKARRSQDDSVIPDSKEKRGLFIKLHVRIAESIRQ